MFDFYRDILWRGMWSLGGTFSLVMLVLIIIGQWKMFEKAGKPGWATFVPIYNIYCLFDIAFGNGWAMLLLLIPIVNFFVGIVVLAKIAQAFGRGTLFQIMTCCSPAFASSSWGSATPNTSARAADGKDTHTQ